MHRCVEIFFLKQNDTKISDFDEGVLILEPFLWSNIIFKICFFCIKSHDRGNEEFLWVPSLGCNTAELRNECFSLFTLSSFSQSKSKHFTQGSQTNWNFRYVNCDFWDRSGKFWKWHCLKKTANRIQTPSSKLMILVSSCWKKNFIRNNRHSLFILSLVFLKSLIVSVAFFLGHPVFVIIETHSALIWQKEASDKGDISGKQAKCVCQWNIRILAGWVFMHKILPGRRAH